MGSRRRIRKPLRGKARQTQYWQERLGSAMRQASIMRAGAAGYVFAVCLTAWPQAQASQTPADQIPANQTPSNLAPPAPAASDAPETVAGGRLHGVAKSGTIPLPGVTVIAQNTLTGKRYSTTTDITGSWQLNIPQNGRYVIRTQFAAFAQGSQEAILNATSHDQLVNFELILASRQAALDQQQANQQGNVAAAVRQMAGNSPENLSLTTALSADTDTGAGTAGASGAALPSIAGNSDFSDESVAITGQAGQVSAMAGLDPDRVRDARITRAGVEWPRRRRWPGRPIWRIRRWWRIWRSLWRQRRGFGGGVEVLAEEAVVEEAVDGETSATSIPASRMGRSPGMGRLRTSTRSHLRCWAKNRTNPSTEPITLRSHS